MSSQQEQWVNHQNTLLQLASASAINPPMIPRPESSQSNLNLSSTASTAQLHHMLQHSLYPPHPPPPGQLTHLHSSSPVNMSNTPTSHPNANSSSSSNGGISSHPGNANIQYSQGFLPNSLPPITDPLSGGAVNRQSPQPQQQQQQHQLAQQLPQHHHQQQHHHPHHQQQQRQSVVRSMTPISVMSSNGVLSSLPNQVYHYQHIQDMQQHQQHQQHQQQQQQQQQQFMLQDPNLRLKKRKAEEVTQSVQMGAKGGSKRTTQENILKLVALKNKDKPLSEYASIVRSAEIQVLNMDASTHAKSEIQTAEQHRERERQVYALIWLMNSCITDAESYVPRGRIFAQYAASCAQNQLKPLSQATLGKLIRALFPYLKTRRLGMRGQSKYHYCGLKLVTNLVAPNDLTPNTSSANDTPGTIVSNSGTASSQSNADNITIKYESEPQGSLDSQSDNSAAMKSIQTDEILGTTSNSSENSLNNLSGTISLGSHNISEQDNNVKIVTSSASDFNLYYDEGYALLPDFFAVTCESKVELPIKFPDLQKYLPLNQSIDPDIASSVNSLYQVYCNTLFENIRFMKFDDLLATLQSFSSGSISSQMYNLFISEELYEWVRQSDLLTHRALTKMLSSLIVDFDEVPDVVLNKLSDFSNDYLNTVEQSTMDLPLPMVTSKKNIAHSFALLVKRLVKVIEASKNLANVLSKQENRLSMMYGWEQHVRVSSIVNQEFSFFNYPSLEKDIQELFSIQLLELLKKNDDEFDLIQFVKSVFQTLSRRNVPARLLVLAFNSLTSAFVKEISSKSTDSFGLWWMFKTFLDEWVFWYAEAGGFLKE